jgi:hypothetical protein
MLSLASREIRDIGIRCWSLDSAIYLIYSTHERVDDEGKILFTPSWQLWYNAVWDVVERRKINRNTAKAILYGLVATSVKNDKLLVEYKEKEKIDDTGRCKKTRSKNKRRSRRRR